MKTILFYFYATMICLGMCIDNDATLIGFILISFGGLMYELVHGKSEEELKKITGAAWLEKKTGIDFLSEE